ncbi:MAG TPA: hypothetical protein VM716_09560 [Gemmatimonadales bacterium]|nr:hypothetical protein [Gemmatimonadales bacterium]
MTLILVTSGIAFLLALNVMLPSLTKEPNGGDVPCSAEVLP